MPEATVNEYGDALDGEHQIRTTGERTGSCGVPNSQLPNDPQHPSLGLSSSDCHSTHTFRYLAGWLERSTGGDHVDQDIPVRIQQLLAKSVQGMMHYL